MISTSSCMKHEFALILKMKFDLREYLKVRAEGDALTTRPHRCVKLSQRCAPLTVNQGEAKADPSEAEMPGCRWAAISKQQSQTDAERVNMDHFEHVTVIFASGLMVDLGPGTRRLPVPSVRLNAIVHLACLPFIHRQAGRRHARALPVPSSSALCSFLCLFLPFHLSNIRIRRSGDLRKAGTTFWPRHRRRTKTQNVHGEVGFSERTVGHRRVLPVIDRVSGSSRSACA